MSNNMESEQNMINDLCKRLAKAQEAADESGMVIDVETEGGMRLYMAPRKK